MPEPKAKPGLTFERTRLGQSAGQAALSFAKRLSTRGRTPRLMSLSTAWPELVGEEVARFTQPLALSKNKGRYRLSLAVEPALAAVLAHNDGGIRLAVEAFLGDGKLEDLRLVHRAGAGGAHAAPPPYPAPTGPPIDWNDPQTASQLGLQPGQGPAQTIRDPELAAALERLARAMLKTPR